MNQCPHCQRTDQQVKNGKTVAGAKCTNVKSASENMCPSLNRQGIPCKRANKRSDSCWKGTVSDKRPVISVLRRNRLPIGSENTPMVCHKRCLGQTALSK